MVWKFQHIEHVGDGASAYTENETITAVDSVGESGKAWIVANVTSNGIGPATTTSGTRNNNQISFRTQLTSTTNAEINYSLDTESRRAFLTVWEQPSTATADRVDITKIAVPYLYNTTTSAPTVAGGTDRDDIVVFKQALRSSTNSQSVDAMLVTGKILNSYAGEFERGGSDVSTFGYVPCVEFWGTDYTIQTGEITSHTAGTTKVTTIASTVDWTETLIIASYRVANGSDKDADCGFLIWPGADGDKINTRVSADHSNASSATIRYYLVSNVNWFVDHDNSIDGSLSAIASGTSTENITIDEVSGTDKVAPICFAYTGGTGQNYPVAFFTYGITSATNLRFYRGKTGQAAEIAYQILDTDPDNRPGGSTNDLFSATQLTASATTFAPAFNFDFAHDVNLISAVASLSEPDVVIGLTVDALLLSVTTALSEPAINFSGSYSPDLLSVVGQLFEPTVDLSSASSEVFNAELLTASVSLIDFGLDEDAGLEVSVGLLSAVASLFEPTVTEDQNVNVPVTTLQALATIAQPVTQFPSTSGSPFDATSIGTGTSVVVDLNAQVEGSVLTTEAVAAVSGQAAITWNDQSGNGNNATQPNSTRALVYTDSAINNYPALVGHSTSFMSLTNRAIFRDYAGSTVFWVLKYNQNNAIQALINCFGAGFVYRYYAYLTDDRKIFQVADHPDGSNDAGIFSSGTDVVDDQIHVIAIVNDYANGTASIWVDSVKKYTEGAFGGTDNTSDTDSPNNLILFASDEWNTNNSPSTFGRVIIYSQALGDSDVITGSDGLADEWAPATTGVDLTYSATQLVATAATIAPTISAELTTSFVADTLSAVATLYSVSAGTDEDRIFSVDQVIATASLSEPVVEVAQDDSFTASLLTATATVNEVAAGADTVGTLDSGLRNIVRVFIFASYKDGTEINLPLVSERFYEKSDWLPIVEGVSNIGDSVLREIPDVIQGSVTLNNEIGSIGYKRRFSDLLDDVEIINREVRIILESWTVDGTLVSELSRFVGAVSSFQINNDFSRVSLRVGRQALLNSPITYTVKSGPQTLPGSVGRTVPLVLGGWQDIPAIRLTTSQYAYGTTFSNTTTNSFFATHSASDEPLIYFTDGDGNARAVDYSTPTELIPNYSAGSYDSSSFRHVLSDSEGKPLENGYYIANVSGSAFYCRVLTGAVARLKTHPTAFAIPGAADTAYIFTVYEAEISGGIRAKRKVGEAQRARADFAVQRAGRNDFTCEFVFPEPIALVAGAYIFALSETTLGEHLVEDIATYTSIATFTGGTFGTELLGVAHVRKNEDAWNWKNSGISGYNGKINVPSVALRFASGTKFRYTKQGLSGVFENSGAQAKDGLSCSAVALIAHRSTPLGSGIVTQISFDNFQAAYLRVPPIFRTGQNSFIDTQMRFLLSTVDKNGDWIDAGAGTDRIGGHGKDETETGNTYKRNVSFALQSSSFRRQAIEQLLFWTQGKLLPFGSETGQQFSLLFFGTQKTTYTEIADEDIRVTSYQHSGLDTVANAPRFSYDFRIGNLLDTDRYTVGNGGLQSVVDTGYFDGKRLSDQNLSIDLYGKNYLRTEDAIFFSDEESAKGALQLFFDRYHRPEVTISFETPLVSAYSSIKVGDIVVFSSAALPNFYGSTNANISGVKGSGASGVQVAPDAALGADQKQSKTVRALVLQSFLTAGNSGIPRLSFTVLKIPLYSKVI